MLLENICFATPFDQPPPSNIGFCGCSFDWQKSTSRSFQQYAVPRPAQACNWSKKRLSEYLAGRYCALKALAAIDQGNGLSATNQLPIRDDHSPQWPQGRVGSISHSHNRAIAIAAHTRNFVGLGIDCETALSDTAAAEIAPWVLHPDDLDCKIVMPIGYGLLITLIFSAKESLFKALAPGDKNTADFGAFLVSARVSSVTAQTLILNAPMGRHRRDKSNTSLELSYAIDQCQITTMALLRPDVPEPL